MFTMVVVLVLVLANQSIQEKKVNTIETNQNILSSNIFKLKEAVPKAGERTTPFPLDGAPASVTQRAPNWAERVVATDRLGVSSAIESTLPPTSSDKMLLVLDSIGSNIHMEEVEKITNTKFVTKKAYCNLPGAIFPNSDYTTVVPESLKENSDTKVLVFNMSASDLTNISPGETKEYCKQQASLSSSSTVKLASNTLMSGHPNLEIIVVPERAPRYAIQEAQTEWMPFC